MKKMYTIFVLLFILIANAYPQFEIQLGPLSKLVNSDTSVSSSLVLNLPSDKYEILKNTTGFDPILAYNFQHVLDSIISTTNLKGVSAAIIMPEKGTWLGVAGISDPNGPDSINSEMLFGISSNTKSFIVALMLKLQEEGLLSLDDKINQWLPDFPNIDSTITIRQLLNHTSGVSDYLNENPNMSKAIWADLHRLWTPEDILEYVLEPNFLPGESWSYSNTGYILAGMIIKEATDSNKVAPILREYILDPLNLDNTFIEIEEELVGNIANGWYYDEEEGIWYDFSDYPGTAMYSSAWTAGAMFSTSENMARWMRLLFNGQVLNQLSFNEMTTLVPMSQGYSIGVSLGYGLGIWKEIYMEEELYSHSGGYWFYLSYATYWLKEGVSVVVLVNQRNNPEINWIGIITTQFLDKIFEYYKYPYDKIYPLDVQVVPPFMEPNQDTLIVLTQINNPENHAAKVFTKIHSLDSTFIDSLELVDGGIHNDNEAGDGLFGGYIYPLLGEKEYIINAHTFDLDSGYHHVLNDAARFTTIGPVKYKGYTFAYSDAIFNPGDNVYIKISLQNNGSIASATDVTANIISLDSLVSVYPNRNPRFGDIAAGATGQCNSSYEVTIAKEHPGCDEIRCKIEIMSNGYTFWLDEFSTAGVIVALPDIKEKIPTKFTLYQNYPNPFNPKTVIRYALPVTSHIDLSIYNILGQKVATLVNKKQSPGSYQIEWDAAEFPSGVYIYRLRADNFDKSYKMILLK